VHDHRIFQIPAGCLREMTVEQFKALQVLTLKNNWENCDDDLFVSGTDYIGVVMDNTGFFLGIEKDGYTHS
jgi:hypothetical protein